MIKVYRQKNTDGKMICWARWAYDDKSDNKTIYKCTNLITSELWKQTIPTAGEVDIGIIKY